MVTKSCTHTDDTNQWTNINAFNGGKRITHPLNCRDGRTPTGASQQIDQDDEVDSIQGRADRLIQHELGHGIFDRECLCALVSLLFNLHIVVLLLESRGVDGLAPRTRKVLFQGHLPFVVRRRLEHREDNHLDEPDDVE